MSVPKYTTPTFLLEFPEDSEIDLTSADEVYVTFAFRGEIVTKSGDDLTVTANTVSVLMSEDETMSFPVGDVQIQVNWTSGANRFASEIVSYPVTDNLIARLLTE